jgi:WhiB family redox-sensing transcriptional regulator
MTASWEPLAACLNHPNPGWWWPERGNGATSASAAAKAVCVACPVIRPCLEAALENREEHGIRGGAGGDQMRWLRRAWLQGGAVWDTAFEAHLGQLDGETGPVNRNGPGATHGLAVTYARGCRCRPCRLAIADRHLRLVVVGERTDAYSIASEQSGNVPAFLTNRRTA